MNIDPTTIIATLMSLLKGIYSQIYSLASQIYPTNPSLVLIIACIVGAYLLKDKISSIVLIAIVAFFIYIIVNNGLI